MSQTGDGVGDKTKALCVGCRNNFYNGNNSMGIKECWSFENSRIVTRYKIGWWTPPTQPNAFEKVRTLDCHHAPGQYAMEKELPILQPSGSDSSGTTFSEDVGDDKE